MEPEGLLLQNSLQLDYILIQLNPIHALPSYFVKVLFNIILPSTSRSFLQVFQPKFCTYSSSPSYVLISFHLMIFDLIAIIIFGEGYKMWRYSIFHLINNKCISLNAEARTVCLLLYPIRQVYYNIRKS
jgi:hypothetical protein